MSDRPSDWNPLDPANVGDPTCIHAQLRANCPVAWTDQFGGFFTITRYADVTAAALDVATFTSAQKNSIPPTTGPERSRGLPWRLDYVGRTRGALAYVDRLDTLDDVHIHLTSATGRPDLGALLAKSAPETPVYACGSQSFLGALESAAADLERPFHAEWFAPKPGARRAGEGALEAFIVRLERSNIEVAVLPGQSIIDACAEVGVTIPALCFEGTCVSCLSTVLEGVPDHRDSILSPAERARNCQIIACVSRSKTGRLVLDW